MSFEIYLENEIKRICSSWHEEGIYALSFLLSSNEFSIYNNVSFFPEFSIGYNTEEKCEFAPLLSEERWNFAYWEQNNIPIISPKKKIAANFLLDWYSEQGIKNIGVPESEDDMFDESGIYVGKGPGGYIELMDMISIIAMKLQNSNFIKERFGNIPIIIHDLEYSWYSIRATQNANPNGEASAFLRAVSNNFEI